jgi:hypothetical protein
MRIVVDFPAPFGPTKPVTRPLRTANERSSTATVPPYRLVSPCVSIATLTARTVGRAQCAVVAPQSRLRRPSRGWERRASIPPESFALARRWLWWATGAIVFGVLLAVSDPDSTLTIAALVGLLGALSLFAARYRRRWSALLVLPFLANAIDPFDDSDPGFAGVLLLFVVVGALVLGDSRRQRGEAIAERGADRLTLRVRDDGPGPAAAEPDGHGLLGMRERALMVGGTLKAGRGDAGGFAVEAELPIGASSG